MPASIDPLQVPSQPSSHHQQFQSHHDATFKPRIAWRNLAKASDGLMNSQ